MAMKTLRDLFAGQTTVPARQHLTAQQWPAAIYAIGDVHGHAELLAGLVKKIEADAADIEGERWLVMLGDYIDRGPDSAGVLDMLLAPAPSGFRRFCLAGNHEAMALAFLDNPATSTGWLNYGGYEAIMSYGLPMETARSLSILDLSAELARRMPAEHIDLLRTLPQSLTLPGTVFVHAGIRRGVPMPEQLESDVLWLRREFFEAEPVDGLLVVHGHTPGPEPVLEQYRICVDTGAYATGRLTAVRLATDSAPRFISFTAEEMS